MTFGFFVNNANGERVIDDESPLFHVTQDVTINYTSGSAGQYSFDLSSYVDGNSLIFVNVPSGDFLVTYLTTFYFPNSTMQIRKCVLADALTKASSGFGMQVLDASGNLTWRADKSILAVTDPYTLPGSTFGTGTLTTGGEDWFCIPNTRIYYQPNGPSYLQIAEGFQRPDATTIKGKSISVSTGPILSTSPQDLLIVGAK